MNDDFLNLVIFFGIAALGFTSFIIVSSFDYDDEKNEGKNEGIIFCMEKPKECKIRYEYLKLQENQK